MFSIYNFQKLIIQLIQSKKYFCSFECSHQLMQTSVSADKKLTSLGSLHEWELIAFLITLMPNNN